MEVFVWTKDYLTIIKSLKKEGFYVIFVCLCIVATIAVVIARNKTVTKPPVVQERTKKGKLLNKPEAMYRNT